MKLQLSLSAITRYIRQVRARALLTNYLAGDPPPASLDLVPVARDEATDLKYVTSNWLELVPRDWQSHHRPALTGELTLDEAIANMIRNGDQILAQ